MIQLNNVTKFFKTEGEKKYILKNINFTIPPNVNLGILGRNGAGKSTFLRMLGGIDFPSSGKIVSGNSFSWPMGLAGGFQGSMTGRQNVKFVGRIYGKSNKEIEEIINSVKEFTEIGDYFDMPIKIYSSGMKSRLSFGLSLAFDFDYLIIDETLSVGDQNFKKKAKSALVKKIESCNVLLVSHSMGDLKQLCDSGVVLNGGELFYFENIDDAIEHYHQLNIQIGADGKGLLQSSSIYCSDGKIFDNITEAAKFYKVRPYGIIQALNEYNGSHFYLKKSFWRDGEKKKEFQELSKDEKNGLFLSSDGVLFKDISSILTFYKERFVNISLDESYFTEILKSDTRNAKKINVQFYYLSEY